MISKKPLRLAVIGCGAVVDHHLLPALRRIGALPIALVDPSPHRLELVSRRMGRPGKNAVKANTWEKIVDQFDAAVVAVPHALHGPIGKALLNAGKHVFMEKPLAISSEDCHTMVATAEVGNLKLSVGLLRRFLHIARWTKALIDSGALGQIQRFTAREGFVFNWATSSHGLLRPELAGGGVLIDTGAHTLDLLLHWLGDVESFHYQDDGESGIEADCFLNIRLKSGATGQIELSRSRELCNSVLIEGSLGYVEVHLSKNQIVRGSPHVLNFTLDGMNASNMPLQLFPELFDAELRDFCSAVTNDQKTRVTGSEAIRSVSLIEQCYRQRQPLRLPWVEQKSATTVANATIPHGSRVVVTGATGFIGGRLVERLVHECGAQVRCLVREIGHSVRLARLPVEIMQVDLSDAGSMDKALAGADYVFHCAYDARSIRQNADAVANLIEASLTHSVKRLVHVSTFSVYEPFQDGSLSEDTKDGDRSWIYVNTKLDLEKQILDAVQARGLRASIVQPSIVYGPFGKPWTNAPAEMLMFGKVVLPDRGHGLCNAVYIDDLIDGMCLAATCESAIGERFLLSGPKPVTWATFFGEFAAALKTRSPEFRPSRQISRENRGFMRDLRLVFSNPKRIVQIVVRWYPARQVLQRGLEAMPKPIRDLVSKYYFGSGGRRVGEIYLPDAQALALYTSRAVVHCEKARLLLGYAPRYEFERGMEPTRSYLEWAYGDVKRSLSLGDAGAEPASAVVIENTAHAA